MEKIIEINGVKYQRIDTEAAVENKVELNSYYSIESGDGLIKFHVLLNDNGEVWANTQCIDFMGHEEREFWDNADWLKDVLKEEEWAIHKLKDIDPEKVMVIKAILKLADERGWMI